MLIENLILTEICNIKIYIMVEATMVDNPSERAGSEMHNNDRQPTE